MDSNSPTNIHNDLISVIVVTYKQQDYLYQTLDSILMQNYEYIELIIADDGTPDLQVEKLGNYIDEKNRGNIKDYKILYDGKNRGTVRNINRALAVTKGDFIKVIGGDDTYVDELVFFHEVEFLRAHKDLYGAISKCQQCDAFMNPIKDERVEKSNANIANVLRMNYDRARKYIAQNDIFPIAVQATIFTREYYEKNGGCDEDYLVIDDSPTVLKILQNHKRFSFLDIFSVKHRSNVGISTSREMFSPKRMKYYRDCMTYDRKEIRPNPAIYGKSYSIFMPEVNQYVYEMAREKANGDNNAKLVFLTLKHSPALVYYFVHNSKKVIRRVRHAKSK